MPAAPSPPARSPSRINDRAPPSLLPLAGWLGVEVEIVTKAVSRGVKAAPTQQVAVEETTAQPNFRPDPNEARLILEREVLKAKLQEPALFEGELWSSIEAGAFTHPAYIALRVAIDSVERIAPENRTT